MLINPSPNARTALASKMRPEFGCAVGGRKWSRMLQSILSCTKPLSVTIPFGSWHGLEYQDRGDLIAERLGRHVKTLELGHEQRRAGTGSGLDLGDQLVVIDILLLIHVEPT